MADEKIGSGRAGKTAGRLLLLLSTVILIAAIVFSSYMGGQSKLMSKLTAYYKSGTIDKIGTLISDNADKDGLLRSGNSFFAITDHEGQHDVAING